MDCPNTVIGRGLVRIVGDNGEGGPWDRFPQVVQNRAEDEFITRIPKPVVPYEKNFRIPRHSAVGYHRGGDSR